MKRRMLVLLMAVLLGSCASHKNYELVKTENPIYIPNTEFKGFENLSNPKFAALRAKYQIDTVFHGETDEFKRVLMLRNWIRSLIPINDPGPHPGDGSPESILDHALKGSGYHCGHYMVVQNAVMNAYGYVTRCLGAGPGGADGVQNHHGIDEIWLNSYNKWFLSDAKYNSHFEKNGIPLSALEVRDEYLKNKAKDIVRVKGLERTPVEFDEEYKMSKEHFARTYSWLEWYAYSDQYTPDTTLAGDRGILNMLNDEYFKNHTWMWDKKPHWAYNTKFMRLVSDRNAIDWTPNTIASNIRLDRNKASIKLSSSTPNFKTYQMKDLQGAAWQDISDSLTLTLNKDSNTFFFRTLNLAGVAGPEYKVVMVASTK